MMQRLHLLRPPPLSLRPRELPRGAAAGAFRGSSSSPKPATESRNVWGQARDLAPGWHGQKPECDSEPDSHSPQPATEWRHLAACDQDRDWDPAPVGGTVSVFNDDSSELLSQALRITEIIVCQQAQLHLLRRAADTASGCLSWTPHGPGSSTVPALQAIVTVLSSASESAMTLARRFVHEVECQGTGWTVLAEEQAVDEAERMAPRVPGPIEGPVSWNLLSSCSDPGTGSCVLPLPFEDPFVDALAAVSDDSFELDQTPRVIDYHSDVTSLERQIFAQPLSPGSPLAGSRRVVLDMLPPAIGLAQVLRAICCYGGAMAASLVPNMSRSGTTRSAIIEFVYADSAAAFARHYRHNRLLFSDAVGRRIEANVWLVPTVSFAYTARDRAILSRGGTRAIALGGFPPEHVWDLLLLVGTRAVTELLPNRPEGFVVEFSSLFEADRAQRLIVRRWPSQNVSFVGDSSQGHCFKEHIDHVAPGDIEQTWKRHGVSECADMALDIQERPLVFGQSPPSIAGSCDASSQQSAYLAERQHFVDTDYHIIGSTIKLTRRAWSWRIHDQDDIKLLMANTLHEPDWADEWDDHFASHDAVNLRRWERYGMLARHRRDKAAEQGIEAWRVPRCDAGCQWACCDIRAAPAPDVVKRYLTQATAARPAATSANAASSADSCEGLNAEAW